MIKSKSTANNINHILDVGTPFSIFESYINSYHQYIDFIKFGWGSVLIDNEFPSKKKLCESYGIKPLLGGTFFEYMIHHYNFESFLAKIDEYKLQNIELSRGTVSISDSTYEDYIRRLSSEYFVMSEVGRKVSDQLTDLTHQQWIDHCHLSVDAGANLVILESRESGLSGYVSAEGHINKDLIDSIIQQIPIDLLLFEAPIKPVQSALINNYGSSINLGNIHLNDILSVQSLRMGLRSDTLLSLQPQL